MPVEVQPLASATTQSEDVGPPSAGVLVLRGRSLLAARSLVAVAMLFCLFSFAVDLSASYAALWQTAERVVQEAGTSGAGASLSPTFYAGASVAMGLLAAIGFVVVALLIVARRSDEVPALLASVTLVAFGLSVPGALQAVATGVPIYAVRGAPLHALGWSLLLIFAYVFPDGRFLPRWARWQVPIWVLWVFGFFLFMPAVSRDRPLLIGLTFVVWIAWFGMGVLARIYRYIWIARPAERQQTKWVALGTFGTISGVLLAVLPSVLALTFGHAGNDLGYQLLAEAGMSLSALLIPVTIGIAILRHRLFDIDLIINRALVYGSLTLVLGAMYFAAVVVFQTISRPVTGAAGSSPPAIVLSTLLIAAAFQPVRGRLQHTIDRRFYRQKYDAAKMVERFASTLRHQVELEDVRLSLLEAVAETLQPTHLSLWLRQPPAEE